MAALAAGQLAARRLATLSGMVVAVNWSPVHSMKKESVSSILLIEGTGVEGDAHAGATVKHRSRVRKDPFQPNLRQVHLIHAELHDELRADGFDLAPGEMGENITTRGIGLLGLPVGTRLCLGESAAVEVTGLRNPCVQLDRLRPGLMGATQERVTLDDGKVELRRKAGIMSIVVAGGVVKPGDQIVVEFPARPHRRLEVV